MSSSSQKPKSVSSTPEFVALASAIDRSVSGDRAADLLADFYNAIERKVRAEIAADFMQFGKRQDSLSWGEAVLIAREGLCRCRGGSKSCDAEDIRELVEGGAVDA